MGRIPDAMGPCGVFCGACPSFGKSCHGCDSDDRHQRRTSKWSCRIRRCAYDGHAVDVCSQCGEYPCRSLRKRLQESHPGDPRFRYRHEIFDNLARMEEVGVDRWVEEQDAKWACPDCGGRVHMYHYRCSQCGREML